ncbi:hypothetical protein E0H26_18495 [Micromonospora zingiberis]|uniref:Uncharacterized protein n=1 Tax=Micromonospora zingiberis TaxID=2053011 RepID=A0A4R0GHQ8_9ACTN|nr:hypothetical protein [Micromonospora zingiberis]TCB95793.1 hypothetical protein E0H26_18495 [Micromonospora zingiberis]
MSQQPKEDQHERVPALAQPSEGTDTLPEADFADEHERTAVDDDILTGADSDEREPESPRGWSGMQR